MSAEDGAQISYRAASSAMWLVASRLGMRAIDLVSLLIMARILTPADFGIVAIAMVLVQVVEAIFELPVSQVLVRSAELEIGLVNTAFTLGALRGLVLALVLCLLSVPFARIYGDPRLVALICFLGLAPALRGLVSPQMTRFARAIDFRRDIVVDIAGKIAALIVAVATAIIARSYWAIAFGTVTSPAVMVIVSYCVAPYRPRQSLAAWRTFSGLLGWTTASQAVTALNWQADWLVLGRVIPPSALGIFSMANNLSALPEQAIIRPIIRPLLSAFSLVRHDRNRLVEAYLRTSTAILLAGLPVMLSLAILAKPAVAIALGPKWQAAAPLLQWMALTLIPPLFTSPLGSLAMALGRTEIFFRQSISEMFIKVPIVVIGALFYGITGVIIARAISAIAMTAVTTWYVRDLIEVPIAQQLRHPLRGVFAGCVLGIALLATRQWTEGQNGAALILTTAASFICGGFSYSAALLIAWRWEGYPQGLETIAITPLTKLYFHFCKILK